MKRTVYFSFETGDFHLVNRFRTKLGDIKVEAKFYDLSLKIPCNPQNNEYIRSCLREKICQSDVVICFITERVIDNPHWVQWEVEEALRQGKKVLAMKLSDEYFAVPGFLEKNNIMLREWSLETLLNWCRSEDC